GPWEFEPLARVGADQRLLPPAGRMAMPCRWGEGGLADFAGRVRFRRHFGYPGRLDATDRVWLTFAGVDGTALICLNGQFLGRHESGAASFEFEVTALLQSRNELQVEVDAPSDRGGLCGEVAMEVRCTAFLRPVRVWAKVTGPIADLHVAGEVVGTAERPLELYVLLDNATVIYTTLEADPAGRPFHLVADALPRERWQVPETQGRQPHEIRIELVNGATVWYRIEQGF